MIWVSLMKMVMVSYSLRYWQLPCSVLITFRSQHLFLTCLRSWFQSSQVWFFIASGNSGNGSIHSRTDTQFGTATQYTTSLFVHVQSYCSSQVLLLLWPTETRFAAFSLKNQRGVTGVHHKADGLILCE